MKTTPQRIVAACLIGLVSLTIVAHLWAADGTAETEYITIRWAGRENTHIIRPGGQVEFIGHELRKAAKPDRADERAFYMNVAMNGLTKEGFKLTAALDDMIIMERNTSR